MKPEDIQPRLMPRDQPLWPLNVFHDQSFDPLYVNVPGAVLEAHPADLLDPDVEAVTLHVGSRVASGPSGWTLTDGLQLPCRKSVSTLAQWVLIELPEGGYVVWEWDQVNELLRRRFLHLESQDEVLPGTDERPFT